MSNPTAIVETNRGTIKVELYGDEMPQTVQNFGSLAEDGYYDGTKSHRIISGFMIQAGDPQTKDDTRKSRWGTGGPGYTIDDEFVLADGSTTNKFPARGELKYTFDGPGVVAMANTGQPRSGGSQFFITLAPTPHLDGKHPIFGRVVDGMDVVEQLGKVDTDGRDCPTKPVVIESVSIDGELPGVDLNKH